MAVFPVIFVNSATGSDSLASGAGPSTAKSGVAAATDGTNGKTVTITDTVDLSGVATDGSAAIYIADATAGHRNFDQITAVAGGPSGSPWTVTVANGFALSLSGQNWAIGGVRASIGGANSAKLINNNVAAGDAKGGWAIEMQSGHAESISAQLQIRCTGDTTNGPIELRGAAGAAVTPIITQTANDTGVNLIGTMTQISGFELRNSNVSKTSSYGFALNANETRAIGVKVADAANNFWRGALLNVDGVMQVLSCEIGNAASSGVYFGSAVRRASVLFSYIHSCGSHGIDCGTAGAIDALGILIAGNICYSNAGCGIYASTTDGAGSAVRSFSVIANTCHANTQSGLEIVATDTSIAQAPVINNILSNNGAYGLKFSGAGATAALLDARQVFVANNDTFANTSGAYLPASYGTNDPGLDPQFTNASGGDFSIGANLKAKGYPLGGTLAIGTGSSTYSYVGIGAAQPQGAVGAAGMLFSSGWNGGFSG